MIIPAGTTTAPVRSAWPMSAELPPMATFPSVPTIARVHVGVTCTCWRLGQLAGDAEAVVSELATNAVEASAGPDGNPRYVGGRMPLVWVRLLSDGITLLIEVHEMAPGQPLLLGPDGYAENGRGLTLVHALTRGRWGWQESPGGKCVWAAVSADSA